MINIQMPVLEHGYTTLNGSGLSGFIRERLHRSFTAGIGFPKWNGRKMSNYFRAPQKHHFRNDIVIGVFSAMLLLAVAHLATQRPGFYSTGFPIDYSYDDCRVCGCNVSHIGSACRAYNPVLVLVDYLFFLGIALPMIVATDVGLRRILSK